MHPSSLRQPLYLDFTDNSKVSVSLKKVALEILAAAGIMAFFGMWFWLVIGLVISAGKS